MSNILIQYTVRNYTAQLLLDHQQRVGIIIYVSTHRREKNRKKTEKNVINFYTKK